jgi:putative redox protein
MTGSSQRIAAAHLDSGTALYAQTLRLGKHTLTADEPAALGGADAGPAPYALMLGALAACTSITLRMYADRKGWTLGPVHIDATMFRVDEVERIERVLKLSPQLSEEQRAKLLEIADKTPVTKTLKRAMQIQTRIASL